MTALTTMLVVVAAMTAAPSAPAVTKGRPPELPAVELPELPALPHLPQLPELPVVPPAATPAPTATPEPAATPSAVTAAATPAATPAATAAPAAPKTSQRRAPARRPATTRRPATKAAARRIAATRRVAAARPSEPARARRPEPHAAAAEPANPVPGIAGDVIELVEALPDAVLWALLGISALALGLAGNAFWQSRQRVKLETQRAELLGDIGLLSSALLPAVPDRLDGLAVSAAYRPADGPAAGGDFYDVFPLDGGRLGVLLGDVSGHGRDSLAQAALARYTLRTLLAAGHAPGEALARADQMLLRELPPHFVTVIAAIYDPSTAVLTYAKAGHAPPIVLGAAYHPLAETPACPLGLGLGESWPEYRLRLDAGVTVCLYTDGLEDARVAGGRVGREQVVRLLVAQPEPDAVRLLADLGAHADAMCDDTAAVVLRRDQPPASTAS
jgi:hypothetical protein